MFQINKSLLSLEIDGNFFSLDAFKHLRDGLLRNTTIRNLPIPVDNIVSIRGEMTGFTTSSKKLIAISQEALLKIIKDIESHVILHFLSIFFIFFFFFNLK